MLEIPDEVKLYLFGAGEWMHEPDKLQFSYKRYKCLILRNHVGALCGYVKIPKSHPWHGKDYDDIEVNIHGGLTFSGSRLEEGDFWIGFDCAHFNDISPSVERAITNSQNSLKQKLPSLENVVHWERTYKNMNYVKEECKSLVDQAIKEQKTRK